MLERTFLPKNRKWPCNDSDFNRRFSLPDLVLRTDTPRRAVWTTSWVGNLTGLVLSAIGWALFMLVWPQYEDIAQTISEEPLLVRGVAWFFAGVAALTLLLFTLMIFFRGKLVVDRELGELRVCNWGLCSEVVRLDEIRLLSQQSVCRMSSDESTTTSVIVPVLVMELHDGTLIQFTEGKPERTELLRVCIEAACTNGGSTSLSMAPEQSTPATPMELSVRMRYFDANITAVGVECFPDDPDVKWSILGVDHRHALSYVDVRPQPDEVGYERFEFVFECESGRSPEVIGCYSWEGGGWDLLFGEDPGERHARGLAVGAKEG